MSTQQARTIGPEICAIAPDASRSATADRFDGSYDHPDVPPRVLRGEKPHESVCVDWLRFMIPLTALDHFVHVLSTWWGEPEDGRGGFFRDASYRWGKAAIYYDPKDLASDASGFGAFAVIEIPASMLHLDGVSDLAVPQWRGLVEDVYRRGGHATRIDVAIDFLEGAGASLVELALAACHANQLSGAKAYKPHVEYACAGVLVNHGLSIGKRGSNGSGRYVRFYDKGLETATKPRGQWVRMELEASGDVARQLGERIALAESGTDWFNWLRALVVGSIDFLEGDKHQVTGRRVRAAWWSKIVDGESVRVVARHVPSSLEGTKRWIARVVAPLVAAWSDHAGLTAERLFCTFGWGGYINSRVLASQAGREFQVWCRESQAPSLQ